MALQITCPFAPCGAQLTTITERRHSLGGPGTGPQLERIPPHPTEGHEHFGQCPASLMEHPVDRVNINTLRQMEIVLINIERDREMRAIESTGGGTPEHSLTPQPATEPPPMFRQANPGGTGEGGGQEGYRRMPPGYLPPARTEGRTVASTAEVGAAIDEAVRKVAESQEKIRAARGDIAEALVKLTWVRETSVDPLGVPQLNGAADRLDEALALTHIASEDATTYRGRL